MYSYKLCLTFNIYYIKYILTIENFFIDSMKDKFSSYFILYSLLTQILHGILVHITIRLYRFEVINRQTVFTNQNKYI